MARHEPTVAVEHSASTLGVQHELKQNFSPLSMLGLSFAILNTWTALSTSLSLALPSGGPISAIWGLVVAGFFNLCLAASLAEFLSAWPTAGGQYHWVHLISWREYRPILSWITGWITVFGWMALVATGGLLGSQLIIGIISMYNEHYVAQRWHQFFIYVAYNLVSMILNAFANSLLPLFGKTAIIWSVSGFAVICITVLVCASPHYNSADLVYRTFINTTGWPDGVAWLLGLLQGGLGLTGFDATAHMIEEMPNPRVEGPKVMIYCVAIGVFTGFVFLSCILFVAGDLSLVISSSAGPLGQIILHATGSKFGTVCLLIFPIVCALFATISIMTASSRMTYAFARDHGLPFSSYFARIHPTLDVPLESLVLTVLVVLFFGCIFLASTSAFSAIVSASVVALSLSYGIPVAISCLRGRKMLPPTRAFILPEWLGWTVNLASVAYVVFTTVFFILPPELPVTGSNMNYCMAAFAIVFIISTVTWIFDGKKNYNGPQVDVRDGVPTASNSPGDQGQSRSGTCKDAIHKTA